MPRSKRRPGVPKKVTRPKNQRAYNVGGRQYYDPGAHPRPANPLPREMRRERQRRGRG